MFQLEHRVRVYVFQVLEHGIEYLLLRQKPRAEWPLGPVVGPIAPGEQMQDAVLREVQLETGLRRPVHLIELSAPHKELFGEMGLVEWPFAYQAGTPATPADSLTPGPMIGEVGWHGFEEAYARIETASDRDALVKLQLSLQ
jgi:hypothetical protein